MKVSLIAITLLTIGSTGSVSLAGAPPEPRSVVTANRSIEGTFACGASMECREGRALTGELDGTKCGNGIKNEGQCADINTLDESGTFYSGVVNEDCEPLPAFDCGKGSECKDGRVLVGYSDGTGCNVANTGKCCRLFTKKGHHALTPNSCYLQNEVECGTRTACAADQVMIGRIDGTGCYVRNQIQCCNLSVR